MDETAKWTAAQWRARAEEMWRQGHIARLQGRQREARDYDREGEKALRASERAERKPKAVRS